MLERSLSLSGRGNRSTFRTLLRIAGFLRAAWTGFAQIYFQPTAAIGVAWFAILMLADPHAAWGGFAGSLVATMVAWTLRLPRAARRSGLYSYNGALCGIALGTLYVSHIALFVWLCWCTAASVLLTHALVRWRIPALTGPFVLLMLVTNHYAPTLGLTARSAGAACASDSFGFVFCSMGQIVFVGPLVLGLLMWYAMLLRDARTTSWALAGGICAWLLALLVGAVWPETLTQATGIGVNGTLAALGLGVFGLHPSIRLAGVAAATVLCLMLSHLSIPYFTLPFNLAVWAVLGMTALMRRHASPVAPTNPSRPT